LSARPLGYFTRACSARISQLRRADFTPGAQRRPPEKIGLFAVSQNGHLAQTLRPKKDSPPQNPAPASRPSLKTDSNSPHNPFPEEQNTARADAPAFIPALASKEEAQSFLSLLVAEENLSWTIVQNFSWDTFSEEKSRCFDQRSTQMDNDSLYSG